MSLRRQQLSRLAVVAQMILDTRTQALRRETAKLDDLSAQISALDQRPAASMAGSVAFDRAAFTYQKWASQRRAAINLQLAAQKATCLTAEAEVRDALGRKIALEGILDQVTRTERQSAAGISRP